MTRGWIALCFCLVIMLQLASCGDTTAPDALSLQAADANDSAGQAESAAEPLSGGLLSSSPEEIIEQLRGASANASVPAEDYVEELPHQRVAPHEFGLQFLSVDGPLNESMAVACYHLIFEPETDSVDMGLQWWTEPEMNLPASQLYIGLADWEHNRWHFFRPNKCSQITEIPDLELYLRPETHDFLVAAVLIGQNTDPILQSVWISDNDQPLVVNAVAPLTVKAEQWVRLTVDTDAEHPDNITWNFSSDVEKHKVSGKDSYKAIFAKFPAAGSYNCMVTVRGNWGPTYFPFVITAEPAPASFTHYFKFPDGFEYSHMAVTDEGEAFLSLHKRFTGEFHIQKTDAAGQHLWAKTYAYQSPDSPEDWNEVNDLACNDLGELYILVTQGSGWGGKGLLLIKCDPHGNLIWTRRWEFEDYESGAGLHIDEAGIVTIVASVNEFVPVGEPLNDSFDIVIIRCDSAGSQLWQKLYNSAAELAGSICSDHNGDLWISGGISEEYNLNYAGLLLELSPDGILHNQLTFTGQRGYVPKVAAFGDGRMAVYQPRHDDPNLLMYFNDLGEAPSDVQVWPHHSSPGPGELVEFSPHKDGGLAVLGRDAAGVLQPDGVSMKFLEVICVGGPVYTNMFGFGQSGFCIFAGEAANGTEFGYTTKTIEFSPADAPAMSVPGGSLTLSEIQPTDVEPTVSDFEITEQEVELGDEYSLHLYGLDIDSLLLWP